MKPICGKGKKKQKKNRFKTKTRENLYRRPIARHFMNCTEDHVMVAALVEGGTFVVQWLFP